MCCNSAVQLQVQIKLFLIVVKAYRARAMPRQRSTPDNQTIQPRLHARAYAGYAGGYGLWMERFRTGIPTGRWAW